MTKKEEPPKEESIVEELKRLEKEDKSTEVYREKSSPHAITISIGNAEGLILGAGAMARSRNIETVRQLLDKGVSPQQILESLEFYFKPATIQDYIRVALKYSKEGGVKLNDRGKRAIIQKYAQGRDT